jgi:hypothetical protein
MSTRRKLMHFLFEAIKSYRLWLRKWVGILLTPQLQFSPATMNYREGFDLRICRLVDGSALLHVPHGSRSGMFCCEVEQVLGMIESCASNVEATQYLSWVNIDGWKDRNNRTITGLKMITIHDSACMLYDKRRLSPLMAWMIKWRMHRNRELDVFMRHYQNFHFMTLLNHLWNNLHRKPEGFVERWVLQGPQALDEAWAEAETVFPNLNEKKHTRALFEVLKKKAQQEEHDMTNRE